ncbi:hypothetical protein MN608_03827 [Microdochium nivale]|nr:hypothetical protein MN608_03827 [Microdochium nivale]
MQLGRPPAGRLPSQRCVINLNTPTRPGPSQVPRSSKAIPWRFEVTLAPCIVSTALNSVDLDLQVLCCSVDISTPFFPIMAGAPKAQSQSPTMAHWIIPSKAHHRSIRARKLTASEHPVSAFRQSRSATSRPAQPCQQIRSKATVARRPDTHQAEKYTNKATREAQQTRMGVFRQPMPLQHDKAVKRLFGRFDHSIEGRPERSVRDPEYNTPPAGLDM